MFNGFGIESLGFLAGTPSVERIRGFRDRRLSQLVQHAFENVAFYRELWQARGFNPAGFRGFEDLRQLPITERTDLRRAGGASVARGFDAEKLVTYRTSGSTGKPATIRRTRFEDRFLQLLRVQRTVQLYGMSWLDRRCAIGLTAHGSQHHPYMRLGILPRSVVDCRQDGESVARQVSANDPNVLSGYASSLAAALTEIQRQALPLDNLRLVTTGGETVTPALLASLERLAAPATVRSTYGAHEVNLLAMECPEGGSLHAIEECSILEALRADGSPAEPGEDGEAVVTALHSFAMPIIRYRLGDIVRRSSGPCACGFEGERLESVLGRTIDMFVSPEGVRYHPYVLARPAMTLGGDAVDGMRIVQHEPCRIEVLVQAPNGLPSDYSESLNREARASLGAALRIEVRLTERIEPEANHKLRPYVCRIESES